MPLKCTFILKDCRVRTNVYTYKQLPTCTHSVKKQKNILAFGIVFCNASFIINQESQTAPKKNVMLL